MAINYNPTRGALDDRENEAFVENDGKFWKAVVAQPDPNGPSFPVTLTPPSNQVAINVFNSVSALSSGTETTVATYTVPAAATSYLQLVQCTGTNVSIFRVKLNSQVIAIDRLWWTRSVSSQIKFIETDSLGLKLDEGDVVDVTVIHSRPYVGDFEARIVLIEVA